MNTVKLWVDRNLKGDPVIWAVVFGLSIISILVVYSATGTIAFKHMKNPESYLFKHTTLIIVGLLAMWAAHRVDYRYYSKLSRFALWISVPLLIYAFTNGVSINDASRWLKIPILNTTFQPSDLASLALITSLASMLSKRQQNISDFKESLIPILIWCGVICGLIALTNLSSAILLFLTCMLIMFIGRVPVRYLAMLVFVGALAGVAAISFGQRAKTGWSRIESFIYGKELPYQAEKARMAVATGGVFGKGPGNSQQRNVLPNPFSDYVYAIIVEEYGIVGGVIVLILYLILLSRGMKGVDESDKAFGGLLSSGLCFAIVLQAMVNMGVVVGLGPITGLPLPLVSMGGTSLLFTGLSIGIILSVSRGEVDNSWSEGKREMKNVARAA
ncbi:MAG: FtsW/RodA/SpoVE family cell cycle protein [Bacteroidota bacterium]